MENIVVCHMTNETCPALLELGSFQARRGEGETVNHGFGGKRSGFITMIQAYAVCGSVCSQVCVGVGGGGGGGGGV